jgi:CDP-4-dehydro-6-deoxyglucose reductase
MTASVTYGERTLALEAGETVLDCLSRGGIGIPHSCRSGVCQSCLMQLSAGEMDAGAQKGLKPTLQKQNIFLACQFKPTSDISVNLPDSAGLDYVAVVSAKQMLNHDVLRLILTTEPFACEPGQYITLINHHGLARSYSVANDPVRDGRIELHIRLLRDGRMSKYLGQQMAVGDRLTVRGPAGNCFYVSDADAAYPIVLAGTGTGLAPLYGIATQALRQGHRGGVHLFHGALRHEDLYLTDELRALAGTYANFTYEPCVLNGAEGGQYRAGNIEDIVLKSLPADRPKTRVFLCGAPELVNSLKRKAFLNGVASKHIFADAFIPSGGTAHAA